MVNPVRGGVRKYLKKRKPDAEGILTECPNFGAKNACRTKCEVVNAAGAEGAVRSGPPRRRKQSLHPSGEAVASAASFGCITRDAAPITATRSLKIR